MGGYNIKNGEDTLNSNGRRLIEICISNDLVIANMLSKHKFTKQMLSRKKSVVDNII